MKYILLLYLVFSSCSVQTVPKMITPNELNIILVQDTKESNEVVWTYHGFDKQYHYFNRIKASVYTLDKKNGTYIIDKKKLYLGKRGFKKSNDGSTSSKAGQIFTIIEGGKSRYDIRHTDKP